MSEIYARAWKWLEWKTTFTGIYGVAKILYVYRTTQYPRYVNVRSGYGTPKI